MDIYDYVSQFIVKRGTWHEVPANAPEHWRVIIEPALGQEYYPSQLFHHNGENWEANDSYAIDEDLVADFVECCEELDRNEVKPCE